MAELQWKKKDFKNGWELYDSVELLGEFDTFKLAKAYAKILVDSGAYCCYIIDRR